MTTKVIAQGTHHSAQHTHSTFVHSFAAPPVVRPHTGGFHKELKFVDASMKGGQAKNIQPKKAKP